MNTFTAPQIDYVAISPSLIVALAALLSLSAAPFLHRYLLRSLHLLLTSFSFWIRRCFVASFQLRATWSSYGSCARASGLSRSHI